MKVTIRYIIRKVRRVVLFLGLTIWGCSCSLEDPRDICCNLGNMMLYVYRPFGQDEFSSNICTLRHFLFDVDGMFMQELLPGRNLQSQTLILNPGRYTMVSVANMKNDSMILNNSQVHIDSLQITHNHPYAGSDNVRPVVGNTDELFWGVSRFDVEADGRITNCNFPRRYDDYLNPTTEMNNIHCHLRVKVEWANMPQYYGDYEMELDGVPSRYTLQPDVAESPGGFKTPPPMHPTIHRIRVPLESYELDGEFITFRLSDTYIPTLRIYFENIQIGPDIDLRRAFSTWGWYPSEIHVQDYAILVRIFGNGSAVVTPLIWGTVNDWINGGAFS